MYLSHSEMEWEPSTEGEPFLIERQLIRFRNKDGSLSWGITPLPQTVAHAHIVRGKDLREGPIKDIQRYYNLPEWKDPGSW